ncbi:MAG: single-stranded DNA-binding protein [Oscillospiraceae bacterium]
MEEVKASNYAFLRGVLKDIPRFSHESRGEKFYQFSLEVCRLSGVTDTINVVARSQLLDRLEVVPAAKLCVEGELRSFNNKSGVGPKLIITVFARELWFDSDEDDNVIELTGTLCKKPTLRTTPMGREICDLMLAVNRRYGRSDYLPCISWGARARESALWEVGTVVSLTGRIQSRVYTKNIDGETVEKTAYEVSVITIAPVEP